ncbi:Uncharacterised protein [Mycobacteroides abscessus subsp. massiliense]|nr:Uncharacterised protein [Mycobacteroides abscessus subsp. massiliense]
MVSLAPNAHSKARSHSSWMTGAWRSSLSTVESTRPTGGPHLGSAIRRTITLSMVCCTSSSRSICAPTRSTVEASAATRSACDRSLIHLPSRPAICASRTFAVITAGDMKFSRTKFPSPSPS